jgi:hypothetical protein
MILGQADYSELLAFGDAVNLSNLQVFEALLVALVLSLVVATVYRISVGDRIVSPSMQGSLVVLAMVGAMVMMIIGNNIARAFSLVGALAIIRFRTRLRSPWDITFVFFSLAVGIAAGVFAWHIAVMGTMMISLAVLTMYILPLSGIRRKIHTLRCDVAAYEDLESNLDQVLDQFLRKRWLVEARSLRFGETLSYRYRIILKDQDSVQPLVRALSDLEGVQRVVLGIEDEGSEE